MTGDSSAIQRGYQKNAKLGVTGTGSGGTKSAGACTRQVSDDGGVIADCAAFLRCGIDLIERFYLLCFVGTEVFVLSVSPRTLVTLLQPYTQHQY